jgi:hypothetical protein
MKPPRCPLCASDAVRRCPCGAVIERNEHGQAVTARRNHRLVYTRRSNASLEYEAGFTGPARARSHTPASAGTHLEDWLPPAHGHAFTKGDTAA